MRTKTIRVHELVPGHWGRWVNLSTSSSSRKHRHEYEMVDHNLRECECGKSQYIEWLSTPPPPPSRADTGGKAT